MKPAVTEVTLNPVVAHFITFVTRASLFFDHTLSFLRTVWNQFVENQFVESKLDDGNLSDDYRTVLKGLQELVETDKTLVLKIKPRKCEFFPLRHH